MSEATVGENPLPDLIPSERANKDAFDRYLLGLGIWLAGENIDGTSYPNPLVGSWLVDDGSGLLTFTETEFTWSEDRAHQDRNCYAGTYAIAPGALTHSGYTLSPGPGRDCISVFQHYTSTTLEGVTTPTNYYGIFIIETSIASGVESGVESDAETDAGSGMLAIVNQRTGGRFTATRTG